MPKENPSQIPHLSEVLQAFGTRVSSENKLAPKQNLSLDKGLQTSQLVSRDLAKAYDSHVLTEDEEQIMAVLETKLLSPKADNPVSLVFSKQVGSFLEEVCSSINIDLVNEDVTALSEARIFPRINKEIPAAFAISESIEKEDTWDLDHRYVQPEYRGVQPNGFRVSDFMLGVTEQAIQSFANYKNTPQTIQASIAQLDVLLWFLRNGYQAASPKDQELIEKIMTASPDLYIGKKLNIYPLLNGKPGKTEKRMLIEKTLSPEHPSNATRHSVKKLVD